MREIEPIVVSWLLSPIGLLVAGIVIIIAVALVMSSLMNGYPRKE